MTERQQYGDEIKATVLAAMMAGQSLNSVAREYKIPKSTLSRWKNETVPLNGTQKRSIGELIESYLRANLETLQTQAEFFADEEWLVKQDASSLAVLHGVMTDKAIRLLEAMSKNAEGEEEA
jgi:hypothetical protein